MLHHDCDDVLVGLVQAHELKHELLVDLIDPLGYLLLVPHGVLEHLFGNLVDFLNDFFLRERVVVLELVFNFCHFSKLLKFKSITHPIRIVCV